MAKLRQRKNADEAGTIRSAAPIPGDWGFNRQAFPASYAQSRLWFLHQFEPDLTAYHLPALWRLTGNLNLNALRLALADLIERHPTLRTSFRLQGSEVLQLIHPAASFPLEPEPLADRNPDAVIEQWLEQERATPFDLSAGLLIRARLLAVDHQHHLLLINHHHIASDGWSRSVLSRDLTELYNARHSGRSAELAPLRVHYPDYAAWQRERLSGDRLQSLKNHWTRQLTGLEPLELPSDHPRPATPSHQGGSVSFQITPELLGPYEELCRLEGATLQMGLLALLALLLHRYSRQDDFAIGVPIWGRNHPDLEPLIGFFVNTLPVRTRFEPQQSFRQLLQQVKASSLAAYDHQELPFEQIVEALNLPRDTSRNPLVQVMLQLIELPEDSLINLDGLTVETIPSKSQSSKLDLSFYLRRSADHGLHGSIAYATDLFSSDRMDRFCSHLLTLLSSALQAPDAPAASLCLLLDSERLLIESWQQGPTIDVPDLCVHQLFEQQVERTPDAIALIFEDQQLTYQELNARSNQLAHHLIDLGVGPEVIVAVCLERSVELIVSLLAILKAGGAYLPLDPGWPEERHALLLKEAACSVMINQDGATVVEDSSLQGEAASGSPLAYVSYTSGSTGKPKGVAISHQSILRLVDPVNGFLLSAGHRVLQFAPVAFDAATFEIWGPLLNGGTLVVAPSEQPTLPALAALLKNHGITTLWLTAGLFHAMVEAELPALAGVQQILAGGDVLSCEHVQRLLDAFPPGHELINGYGPTENTTFTCCQHFTAAATVDPNGVPIGRPIANTDVWVLDEGGQPCPIGIPGELHIGGGGLARGYLNNPELTAEKFIHDPFSSDPSARLYKSGDLASWNPDGTLAFQGRIDQQIKLRGFRIEPGEIETHLLAHPAVAQAVVLVRHEDPNNPRLIAYWVAVASQPSLAASSSDQLRAFLADRLPDYMVPAAFLQLEALPLTPNGKLDRKALPAPSFSGDLEQRVEPSTDLERQLHAIWAEVLGHSGFGITDNFFAIGGHSLAAARLVSKIEMVIGSSPALASIFHNPTISGLAQLIQARVSSTSSLLVTLQPKGSRPPLFVIHGWGGTVWGFVDLARALAPERPVYGIQAPNVELGLSQQMNVREMAMEYADQILASRPKGRIHLLGFSAGGWYAHAVAEALLERGADLGFLGVLDTGPTTLIHRRIGIILLSWHLSSRLTRHFTEFIRSRDSSRSRYVLGRLQAVKALIIQYLHVGSRPVPVRERTPEGGSAKEDPTGDPFVELLYNQYRPKRLPIQVDIFAPNYALPRLKILWRFYARKGVRCHAIFSGHHDFYDPGKSPELAATLELALTSLE
ncbi:MAG: non-ribosomal peptide synthetase [Cyanobium sp.]